MNPITETTQFTDLESEEVVAYRPVNRFAILTVVLGLLSATTLLHPFLLVIPAAGLITAVFAARQLSRTEPAQTGRAALKWGIFLCVLFGTCSATAVLYRQNRLNSQAREFAEKWFELVRAGKFREAHQLTLDDDRRAPPGQSLDDYYRDPEGKDPHEGHDHPPVDMSDPIAALEASPAEQLHAFLAKPVVVRMKELGSGVEYRYLRTQMQQPTSAYGLYVEQHFGADYQEGGTPQQLRIRIVMERTMLNRVGSWKVAVVEETSAS